MNPSKAIPALILLPVFAATADASQQETQKLNPIVVTATLAPSTQGESLSSVTVLEEEEITRQQALQFSELLESQPGINVTNTGSFGKQTSVFIRGHDSSGAVLLVDGIRLRSATSGAPAWQHLPPQMIKRVEIVRGSRSSLYGADATGGVIQAFTLPETKQSAGGWVEVGAGNFDSQQYGAGFSFVERDTKVNVGTHYFRTDGAPVVIGGEDKAYDNHSSVASASHVFSNGVKVSGLFLNANGTTEYEGGETDFTLQTAGASLDAPITRYWRAKLQVSDARDEGESFAPGSSPTFFDTRSRTTRLENWLTWGVHEFVVGAERMTDQVSSTTAYEESSRANNAYFAQALLGFGPADLHLSIRNDDNEAYGKHTTWGAAAGYQFDRQHRVRVSAGTSFKAPSFNDLYWPNYGDPTLEPEEAISYEVGLAGRYTSWFWDVALFQSDVDDLSLSSKNGVDNVPEARLRGVEASAGLEVDKWLMKLAGTFGDYEDSQTGDQLRRRAEQSIRLDVDRLLGRWSVGGTARAENHRFNAAGEEGRLPGYGLVDLRTSWSFAPDWVAKLSVKDVFDKTYHTASRWTGDVYTTAGRTAMLTVRYDIR
ncbi:vitamin B12 transporter BtuB [Marinobacter sp. JH2]|nr:TonB-dependent receptor [Marinobacter sp. JH2]QBM18481.1 vitamin B12 transporter BtuB [Marinobacter sp. JH2]